MEGVPYETVLKDATVKEQQLPESADVVVIGTVSAPFMNYSCINYL